MSLTVEQIEEQISTLQKMLEEMKNPKLKISRFFTGYYFAPYLEKQYRRMESESVPIWEIFDDTKKTWELVESNQSIELENVYIRDCFSISQDTENVESESSLSI